MKTFRLRDLPALTVVALGLLGTACAQPEPAQEDYARRCLAKIQGMTSSRELSDWQAARIAHLLQDQASMIDLFTRHGLLDGAELNKKILTIEEITRAGVTDVLNRDQLAIWWTWDLKLDAASLRKPPARQRLLPGR
jgi:hypothetical protein